MLRGLGDKEHHPGMVALVSVFARDLVSSYRLNPGFNPSLKAALG
jgi:hypothetical protein